VKTHNSSHSFEYVHFDPLAHTVQPLKPICTRSAGDAELLEGENTHRSRRIDSTSALSYEMRQISLTRRTESGETHQPVGDGDEDEVDDLVEVGDVGVDVGVEVEIGVGLDVGRGSEVGDPAPPTADPVYAPAASSKSATCTEPPNCLLPKLKMAKLHSYKSCARLKPR
jgi:hypothetical protein